MMLGRVTLCCATANPAAPCKPGAEAGAVSAGSSLVQQASDTFCPNARCAVQLMQLGNGTDGVAQVGSLRAGSQSHLALAQL